MDSLDHFVIGGMDMPAYNALAIAALSEVLKLILVLANKADRALYFGFDDFAEGKILFAAPGTVMVIKSVDLEKGLVADVAQDCQPLVIDGHGVKAVAVNDQIFTVPALKKIFVYNAEFAEVQWQEAGEDVVMIAAHVDDLGAVFLDFLEDESNKAGVFFGPAPFAGEAPAVNDIAIEDDALAMGVFHEMIHLINFAIQGAQMNIREDNCFEGECRSFHEICTARECV